MKKGLFLTALTMCMLTANSQVVINELLASNQNDIVDEMLQTSDWFEIYNPSPAPLDLGGYYLSDDETNLIMFQLPTDMPEVTTIPGQGHLLIWADNDPLDGPLHANFRLSSNGDMLILTAPDGTTVLDMITFGPQQSDISYGRSSDGASDWVYFNNTTPGESNNEITPPVSFVFVNEVMAFNLNNITDLSEEHEGWIEIYNPNASQVNLANYYIGTPGDPLAFQIPATDPVLTTIDAGGFLVFWMDAETEEGANHVNFELPLSGGTISITAPNGSTTVNSYNYPEAVLNESWGRVSDGGLGSQSFVIPTPRVTNALVIQEPEELYINEVMGANQTDVTDEFGELEDWVEIYNPNNYPVDIGGYFLTDNPENPMKWMVPDDFPDDTTIPANSWILLWADEDGIQGPLHMSFRINNQGEDIRLYSTDGFSLADRVVTPYITPDQSYGRLTDGNPEWIHFAETTPDASNNGAMLNVVDSEKNEIFIYPVPASETLHLSEFADVQVFDLSGRLIEQFDNCIQINLSRYVTGQYLLKINNSEVKRISVVH